MSKFKETILMKLMVQEELLRGTSAHWGIQVAIDIVENTPEEDVNEDDLK